MTKLCVCLILSSKGHVSYNVFCSIMSLHLMGGTYLTFYIMLVCLKDYLRSIANSEGDAFSIGKC